MKIKELKASILSTKDKFEALNEDVNKKLTAKNAESRQEFEEDKNHKQVVESSVDAIREKRVNQLKPILIG